MTYRYPDTFDLATSALIARHGDREAWRMREEEDLSAVLAALPDGGRVLDVGAGRGRLAIRLADRFETVVALEPDPERAAECEVAVSGMGNIAVVVADLLSAPLPESFFDAVVCHHVVQHVPVFVLPAMLERMRRLLVPGGALAIVTASATGDDELVALETAGGTVATRRVSPEEFDTLAAGGPGPLPVHLFADRTLRDHLSRFTAVDVTPLGGEGVLRSALAVGFRGAPGGAPRPG